MQTKIRQRLISVLLSKGALVLLSQADDAKNHMKKSKKDKSPFSSLKSELKMHSKNGIALLLQGKPSDPYAIANACKVSEPQATYMRDYISDDAGKLKEIDFHRIAADIITK